MGERVYRDVLARGVRLRVAEDGTGPSVLYLHGLYLDHSTWQELTRLLGEGFHHVTPDLPGFGESEKPPTGRFAYDIDAFTDAIVDLYGGLGLGRATVVGQGLGGAIAIALAARHPELVSKLVLLDAAWNELAPSLATRLAQVPVLGSLVVKQLAGRVAFRAFFRRTLLAPDARLEDARIDRYYDLFNTPAARGSALATLRATADARAVAALTPRIETPTLVVWGRHDRICPAAFGQRLAREIRGARLELLDAGHCPQEERPQETGAVIRRFLGDER
ncbi:MAG: alpha/beta hydrolase [Sorangiineae bacterium PRO1]|nr:alpha/beta hydrolase [Sorangiineae bacterium PRO1]